MVEIALIGLLATALSFRILRMTTGRQASTPLDKKKFLLHVAGLVLLLGYCLVSPLVSVWIRSRTAEDSKVVGLAAEAESLRLQGNLPEAADRASKAVAQAEGRFGPEDVRLLEPLDVFARCLAALRRYGEAEGIRKRALSILVKKFGEDSEEASGGENSLGTLYVEMERYAEAEALYQRVLARTQRTVGQVPPVLPTVLENLAHLCEKTGRSQEAKDYANRARAFKPSR